MQSVIYSRSSHNKKQQRSFNSNSLNNALYHSPFFVKSVNNNLFNTRQASLYKNKYSSSEPSLLLPCLYIQKASTQLRRLHSTQIRRLHSTSNNINDQYTQRPDEFPIWPKIIEQSWKLEKLFKSFKESKIISDETIEWREFFDEMEMADEVKLSAGVSIIKLNFKNLSLFGMNEPQNIIVRDFYPDLFDKVIASERVILIGNPGIGKSWFQWYMIYRWIKDLKANEENNSMADSTRRRDPPNIVIRQESSAAFIFFLSEKRVFRVKTFLEHDLRNFNENAYYLFEPSQKRDIEVPYSHRLPILASVSPDITRYKEFAKNGGRKIFMPCWKLEELLSVGEVYNYPPLKIRERFAKFGGIIRYVFLNDVDSKEVEINQQNSIDSLTSYDLNNLFRSTIEKSPVQDRIPSISHFIKQFNVITDPNNPYSFMGGTVKLEWASEYVRDAVYNKLQNDKYFEIVQTALNMCKGVLSPDPILFESLTAKGATRCEFEICAKKKIIGKDVVESEMINSKLPQFKSTELWENQKFDDLKENVLYRPKSKQYPFVDFIFKMSNELCALQISISKSHPKKPSTFLKFFDGHLKSQDSITCAIYYITTPDNVDSYIKATRSTFFSDEPELKDEVNAKFENALSRTTFYIINSFYSPSFFTKEVQNSNDRNDK